MSTSPPPSSTPPAQIAKAAFGRLVRAKLEPTPENYARAYAIESGQEPPSRTEPGVPAAAWQALLEELLPAAIDDAALRTEVQSAARSGQLDDAQRLAHRARQQAAHAQSELAAGLSQVLLRLVRSLERGSRQWTLARKKDGLQRVLDSNRSDPQRLLQRLTQLMGHWDADASASAVEARQDDDAASGTPTGFFSADELGSTASEPAAEGTLETISLAPFEAPDTERRAEPHTDHDATHGDAASAGMASRPSATGRLGAARRVAEELHGTLQHALGHLAADETRAAALQTQLARKLELTLPADDAASLSPLTAQARRLLDQRQNLFEQLRQLCRELGGSLTDLAAEDSWAQGQSAALEEALAEQPLTVRSVRSVSQMLHGTRERQRGLREERHRAEAALKSLLHQMLDEIDQLGGQTGRYADNVGRYADAVENADSLQSLAGIVREMVEESRAVHAIVEATHQRLQGEHERVSVLNSRVTELESELRRVSSEAHTDQLTRIANRRGLEASFSVERARQDREGGSLTLALLDIDNFKKLNDSLGHAAGDEALKSLAERTQSLLRPGDLVARYGGEEFVLMLPATGMDEAEQVLLRLQRSLSASLFMHEGRDVFVTFSAGFTLLREGESLDEALARADEGLYTAKRTGKNRACRVE